MNELLMPGAMVMVKVGGVYANMRGHLPLVCMGEVVGRVEDDGDDSWWINVFMGGVEPLAQMYRSREILGTPGPGLIYRPTAAFICPRCGWVGHHPKDVEQGYCGACHEQTGGTG